jgi:hypothetical protein
MEEGVLDVELVHGLTPGDNQLVQSVRTVAGLTIVLKVSS